MNNRYDVLIIGGGPAGLSAALTLARGRRTVLIIDDKKPRNARARHMQNFPSHDGLPPAEFKSLVMKDLKKYPNVHFIDDRVDRLLKTDSGFSIQVNGNEYVGRKIMLSHGMKDIVPSLPGFQELWGKAIFQCPYCHGYELTNSPMALIGSGMVAKHMLPILKGLTDDLMLFTDGEAMEDRDLIQKNGISIIDEKISGLEHENEKLQRVILADGRSIERSYLFMRVPQLFSTDLGTQLGCAVNEMGFYAIDEMGKTSVNGIYAGGDIVTMRQSVLIACAGGQIAGASLNYELLSEDFLSKNG